METPTAPTQTRRLPLELIAFVEAQQRPRETFGEAARRLLLKRESADAPAGRRRAS